MDIQFLRWVKHTNSLDNKPENLRMSQKKCQRLQQLGTTKIQPLANARKRVNPIDRSVNPRF